MEFTNIRSSVWYTHHIDSSPQTVKEVIMTLLLLSALITTTLFEIQKIKSGHLFSFCHFEKLKNFYRTGQCYLSVIMVENCLLWWGATVPCSVAMFFKKKLAEVIHNDIGLKGWKAKIFWIMKLFVNLNFHTLPQVAGTVHSKKQLSVRTVPATCALYHHPPKIKVTLS